MTYLDTAIDGPDLLGLGRDGSSIAVAFGGDDGDVVREMKADGSAWSDPFPVGDADGIIWDPATYKLIGRGELVGDRERYIFLDSKDQKTWDSIAAAFPGARVTLASFTDDHERFVIHVDSATDGPSYYLSDVRTKEIRKIDDEYAGLTPQDIAPVRPIAFKAKDGLALTGYLTLPRGRDPRGLPLVVFPHGGPALRDQPGFDWWVFG